MSNQRNFTQKFGLDPSPKNVEKTFNSSRVPGFCHVSYILLK
ncbi:hypothetical protein CDSM653_01098 [Caldanaerobacter subterraneus subsp. pacificus DSM 12653]|uniref:Uncharacterized protein n=1 Tax=Caldanaerobacter subterraneus subsp. pacificus DSM 12653 TaxID=391606 RepID=A0A0F5PPU2_9THEO|nr:hypothetical protein CDSM653_01098 [Caldanaerobacter subterraneus subsp. pacificus DSM 12653]